MLSMGLKESGSLIRGFAALFYWLMRSDVSSKWALIKRGRRFSMHRVKDLKKPQNQR
jgi:hypothetical protein